MAKACPKEKILTKNNTWNKAPPQGAEGLR